jgi:tetratricopeptide (TPR) repeat protein
VLARAVVPIGVVRPLSGDLPGAGEGRLLLVSCCLGCVPAVVRSGLPKWGPMRMAGHDGGHAQAFAEALRALYEQAGRPSYSVLAHQGAAQRPPIRLTDSSISDWLNGVSTPSKPAAVAFLVRYLKGRAIQRNPEHRSPALGQWEEMRRKAQEQRHARRGGRRVHREASDSEAQSIQKTSPLSPGVADPAVLPMLRAATSQTTSPELTGHSPVRTLPRDLPDFTGRDAEIAYVLDTLQGGAGSARSLAIHAVDGMAGIGKTSLAVRIGHQLASQYPDALFLDLRAHTEGQPPLQPGEALERLLTMLGVPRERISMDFDQRVAQWRTELATRRVLIILDNVASAEQVEELLPGASDCLVIITSRARLIGLDGVLPLSLDIMEPVDAIELFMRILGPDRVRAEAGPVAAAALQCGYLPLAIRLVASWLRHHPAKHVNYVLDRLSGTLNAISTAFQLSYRDLNDDQKLMFRRLGLHPGLTFTHETAAALSEMDAGRAQVLLDELYDRHLIEEPQGNRYRFHDLIRNYARNLANDQDSDLDRRAAANRLVDYYIAAVESQERTRNYKWFDDEMPELLSCAYHAAEQGQAGYAWRLTRALAVILQVRGLYRQARRLHVGALEAAETHGDKRVQASCHINLSILDRENNDRRSALHHGRAALRLCEELGDELGQANAVTEIGVILREITEYQNSREYLLRALGIYAELGSGIGQGNAAIALATLFRETGDHQEARKYLVKALNLYTDSDEPLGKANAHFDLGALDELDAENASALNHFHIALTLHTGLGNLSAQADAHTYLGDLYDRVGNHSEALRHWTRAHDIYSELKSARRESLAERIERRTPQADQD